MKREGKKPLIIFLSILVITFSLLLLIEGSLRLFFPQPLYDQYSDGHPLHEPFGQYDKEIGWVPKEEYSVLERTPTSPYGLVRISHSRGFRGGLNLTGKPIIYLSGDSMVYSAYVDDSDTVSEKLKELIGDKYDIINGGSSSYGTDLSLLRYMRIRKQFHPAIVVHFGYPNDLSDNLNTWSGSFAKPKFSLTTDSSDMHQLFYLDSTSKLVYPDSDVPFVQKKRKMPSSVDGWLGAHSEFYTLIRVAFADHNYNFTDDGGDAYYWSTRPVWSVKMKYAFFFNAMLLEEYHKRVEEDNTTFILLEVPHKIIVDPIMQKNLIRVNGPLNFTKVYDYEKLFAVEEGFNYYDLMPAFVAGGKELYLDRNTHMNPEGLSVLAREVQKAVELYAPASQNSE